MKISLLTGYLKSCFGDVRFGKLDQGKRSRFVIERILEYGGREAADQMFAEVLVGNTGKILALSGPSEAVRQPYLGGGTGPALPLGHRVFSDRYLFRPAEFDEQLLLLRRKEISRFSLETIA
jgi:hypothetical protein